MHIALGKQPPTYGLAGATLKQDVVRHDHGGAAVDRQQCLDVLDEVELLVRGGRPEVVAHDHQVLARDLALVADERHRRLAPERWVRQHHLEPLTRIRLQHVIDSIGLLSPRPEVRSLLGLSRRRRLVERSDTTV